MESSLIIDNIVKAIPSIAAWSLAVILAAIMVRHGGKKPEKLFLTGSCLMLAATFACPLLADLWNSAIKEHGIRAAGTWLILPCSLLNTAGFVCLALAFWQRFWKAAPKQIEQAKEGID